MISNKCSLWRCIDLSFDKMPRVVGFSIAGHIFNYNWWCLFVHISILFGSCFHACFTFVCIFLGVWCSRMHVCMCVCLSLHVCTCISVNSLCTCWFICLNVKIKLLDVSTWISLHLDVFFWVKAHTKHHALKVHLCVGGCISLVSRQC